MSLIRARQGVVTRIFPHQGNRRYLIGGGLNNLAIGPVNIFSPAYFTPVDPRCIVRVGEFEIVGAPFLPGAVFMNWNTGVQGAIEANAVAQITITPDNTGGSWRTVKEPTNTLGTINALTDAVPSVDSVTIDRPNLIFNFQVGGSPLPVGIYTCEVIRTA